eukprot:1705275-Lingulodinium_polyedra.AAC.1
MHDETAESKHAHGVPGQALFLVVIQVAAVQQLLGEARAVVVVAVARVGQRDRLAHDQEVLVPVEHAAHAAGLRSHAGHLAVGDQAGHAG